MLRSRAFQALVAVALLAALYTAADWRAVCSTLVNLRPGCLAAALALFVPQTLVSALRWREIAACRCDVSRAEAIRQVLASSALNLVVPSKLGDLSKAAMLPLDPAGKARATVLVIIEKSADVAALLLVLLAGTLGAGSFMLITVAAAVWFIGKLLIEWTVGDNVPSALMPRVPLIAAASLALWTLHMAQIELFLRSAGIDVASSVALTRIPLAIFAGLVPITLWGVGTRDSALVWLFRDMAPTASIAAVGLLTALRYLIPGACGIAFVTRYVGTSGEREAALPAPRRLSAAKRYAGASQGPR